MSIQHDDKAHLARRQFVRMVSIAPFGLAGLGWLREGAAQNRPGITQALPGAVPEVLYTIDTSIRSANQDARVRSLVLHYTALSLEGSLAGLTQPSHQVSAHYLVPDGAFASHVYQLVPDENRAWHAGISQWQRVNELNYSSIGMEIVNLGFPPADQQLPPMQRRWYPYDSQQIAVVGALAADIVRRYSILPHRVVGHADIAPGRKSDPGPLFPWQYLYERYNVGAWPDRETVNYYMTQHPFHGDIGAMQTKLARYGYAVPQNGVLDKPTMDVITSFQMHFRPQRYDGMPDSETSAILDALLAKYFPPTQRVEEAGSIESSLPDENEKGY
jgi:N-acetylmuramoyl-L-alanine amidase